MSKKTDREVKEQFEGGYQRRGAHHKITLEKQGGFPELYGAYRVVRGAAKAARERAEKNNTPKTNE